jgi:tetraacyldisaccharide 4'-kinase
MSVCGVGKPESFQKSLSGLNIHVVEKLIYPDHHSFSKKDVSNIGLSIEKNKIEAIVCTEKDWVKLSSFKEKISAPIYAIKLKHSLNEEVREAFLRLL